MVYSNKYYEEYLEYIDLFNERDFYDCHEALEELWLDYFGPDRRFYQGLIHLATAYQLLWRQRLPGSKARFASTLTYLADYPENHLGLNLNLIRENARLWLNRLETDFDYSQTKYIDNQIPLLALS